MSVQSWVVQGQAQQAKYGKCDSNICRSHLCFADFSAWGTATPVVLRSYDQHQAAWLRQCHVGSLADDQQRCMRSCHMHCMPCIALQAGLCTCCHHRPLSAECKLPVGTADHQPGPVEHAFSPWIMCIACHSNCGRLNSGTVIILLLQEQWQLNPSALDSL